MTLVTTNRKGVSSEKLEKLKDPFPVKWKIQNGVPKNNPQHFICVAYIDARCVQDRLDKVCGMANWKSETKVEKDNLYSILSILVEGEWIPKTDVGKESAYEKEKGEVSDALKRAGVHWGIGRFLYELPMQKVKAAKYEKNGKIYPCDDRGNILWDGDALTNYLNKKVKLISKKEGADCTEIVKEYSSVAIRLINKTSTEGSLKQLYNFCGFLKKDKAFLQALETKVQSIRGNNNG